MNTKVTLLLFAIGFFTFLNAQVVLQENFSAGWTPSANNWMVINKSQPLGSTSWFPGSATQFTAYNGAPGDYIAADVHNVYIPPNFPPPPVSVIPKEISDWLITPTLTIYNGAVLQFATCSGQPYTQPNRLQVRMSQSDPSPIIINGSGGVGTFTDLLLDINPSYSTSITNTAVSGNTVNGYPAAWTVYSIQVSGVTGTVTGRFAFRYYVIGAGSQRASYIGIDEVKYTLPCMADSQSITACPNQPVTLQATGGLVATTYSWAGPGNFSSNIPAVTVTAPLSGTAIYTLYPSVGGSVACSTSAQVSITVNGQLPLQLSVSESSVCSGNSVTLTAVSPANVYVWSASGGAAVAGSGASVVVTPAVNTIYTVSSSFGTAPNQCTGSASVSVNVLPLPIITFTRVGGACVGSTVYLHAGGASDYVWYGSDFNATQASSVLLYGSLAGPHTFTVFGKDTNGCIASISSGYTVSVSPTLTVVSSQMPACLEGGVELTASGADSYAWSGDGIAAGSTGSPLSYSTGTGIGNRTIVVTGINGEGCAGTSTLVLSTVICVGIESYAGSSTTAVYPNPFSNELHVVGLTGNMEIYNMMGQLVTHTILGHGSKTVDTAEMLKGMYLLKIYNMNGDTMKTMKLFKN